MSSNHPASSLSDEELGPPPALYLMIEGRALGEFATTLLSMPLLRRGPKGDRHPVMVLPGFLASGLSTRPLRSYLGRLDYRPHCWGLGRNLGLRPGSEAKMLERLEEIHGRSGQSVSLIGWSLGGVFARLLAHERPDLVRQVITLGSPFTGNPRANHTWRLFERLSGRAIEDIEPEKREKVRSTPPVPTTSIYSRTDGVTAWQCCLEQESDFSESLEVDGSHLGLGVNPIVLSVIADRLAQDEDDWRPLERNGLRKWLYRKPGPSQSPP